MRNKRVISREEADLWSDVALYLDGRPEVLAEANRLYAKRWEDDIVQPVRTYSGCDYALSKAYKRWCVLKEAARTPRFQSHIRYFASESDLREAIDRWIQTSLPVDAA
jgi:hypothetical protein